MIPFSFFFLSGFNLFTRFCLLDVSCPEKLGQLNKTLHDLVMQAKSVSHTVLIQVCLLASFLLLGFCNDRVGAKIAAVTRPITCNHRHRHPLDLATSYDFWTGSINVYYLECCNSQGSQSLTSKWCASLEWVGGQAQSNSALVA